MDFDWQLPSALAGVAAAAVWLGWRLWSTFSGRSRSRCGGGCSGCPTTSADAPPPGFVSLDQVVRSGDAEAPVPRRT